MSDAVAKAIYWAAFEMYPPDGANPVARMTKDQAWDKTSESHRQLARFQAQRAMATLALESITTSEGTPND